MCRRSKGFECFLSVKRRGGSGLITSSHFPKELLLRKTRCDRPEEKMVFDRARWVVGGPKAFE